MTIYYNNEIPKLNDIVFNCESKEIYKVTKDLINGYEFPIIATNNPSINLPQIIDEIEILALKNDYI